MIRLLEKVKLAKNVKVPRPELVARRRAMGKVAPATANAGLAGDIGD